MPTFWSSSHRALYRKGYDRKSSMGLQILAAGTIDHRCDLQESRLATPHCFASLRIAFLGAIEANQKGHRANDDALSMKRAVVEASRDSHLTSCAFLPWCLIKSRHSESASAVVPRPQAALRHTFTRPRQPRLVAPRLEHLHRLLFLLLALVRLFCFLSLSFISRAFLLSYCTPEFFLSDPLISYHQNGLSS